MQTVTDTDIAIIGGGIIGLNIAECLSDAGHQITLLEKQHIAAGASAGNAGVLAYTSIQPLASIAMLRKAVKWFLDPSGSFSVIAQDLAHTAPWLLKFAWAARPSQVKHSTDVLTTLLQQEQITLTKALARSGLGHHRRESGALHLYPNHTQLQQDAAIWQAYQAHNIAYQILQGDELHQFQQGLSPQLGAAVFTPDVPTIADPKAYCLALHDVIQQRGVSVQYHEITRLQPTENGVTVYQHDTALLHAKHVILAAGPWSAALAAQLDDKIPLIGERGYTTTLPKTAFPILDKPLFFATEGFVMSPLHNGIWVGGASEIAKLERPANYQRSKLLLQKARQLVPALQAVEGHEWMGKRPTTPDTLPVIGYSTASERIIYAFGHGHLGLTLASSTADMVLQLLNQKPIPKALSARRFK